MSRDAQTGLWDTQEKEKEKGKQRKFFEGLKSFSLLKVH
jgi:hypothetical protein